MAARKTPKKPGGKPPAPPEEPIDPADVPLSEDEQRFVEEYIIDRVASRAYRSAFPGCNHYSARVLGSRMLSRVNVRREIQAAIHAQSVRTQITADKVLKEIARVAMSDIWELYDPATGRLRHPRHIPFETRKAIASIRINRERRSVRTNNRTRTTITEQEVEYRFWPKMEALAKLCKHLGLDTEITPLDALLRALPPTLAGQVRAALNEGLAATTPSANGNGKAHV